MATTSPFLATPPTLTPLISIDLDRRRTLRLTNRAIFTAERALSDLWGHKVSLFNTLADAESLGFNDLSVLLWQALLHEDPRLTLAQVQNMMDFRQLTSLIEAILGAWNAATTPAEGQAMSTSEDTNGPLAGLSPGSASGAMPESN